MSFIVGLLYILSAGFAAEHRLSDTEALRLKAAGNPNNHTDTQKRNINKAHFKILIRKNQLEFKWSQNVSCGLFEWQGRWFLVFGQKSDKINLPRERYFPAGIKNIRLLDDIKTSSGATIYELSVLDSFVPEVDKRFTSWILKARPRNELTLDRRARQLRGFFEKWPSMAFSPLDIAENIFMQDPVTGANFIAVLTYKQDYGFTEKLRSPYAHVLKSGQGIAMEVSYENVVSIKQDALLKIRIQNKISPLDISKRSIAPNPLPEFYLYNVKEKWDPASIRRIWDDQLLSLNDDAKPLYYLSRAWFEMGLGDEARTSSFLDLAIKKHDALRHHPVYRMIRAIEQLFTNDYQKTLDHLHWLPNTPEVKLWRAIAASKLTFPKAYVNSLRESQYIYPFYPIVLGSAMIEEVLMLLIDAEELLSVSHILTSIPFDRRKSHTGIYEYAAAMIKKDDQNSETALTILRALSSDKKITQLTPRLRARVLRAKSDILLASRTLSPGQYLAALDSIKLIWRGGPFEFNLLRDIAELELRQGLFVHALRSYGMVKNRFPEFFRAFHIDAVMENILVQFFNQNLDLKSPLHVIAVYEEFKEFLPDGDKELKIVQKIAALLISLDLLEQAAELLNKTIPTMKDGEEKIKAIFVVAKLHLRNRTPKSTIAILNYLPDQLSQKHLDNRQRYLALAYHLSKDNHQAFIELEKSVAPRNKILLADLFTYEKNWEQAANILQGVVHQLENPKYRRLKENVILKLAIANFLNDDLEANVRLGLIFKTFMKDSKNVSVFNMLIKGNTLIPTNRDEIFSLLNSVSLITESLEHLDGMVVDDNILQ